jgi:hypothetical protein
MITGGAITSFFYNLMLQHPTQKKPLIDYDICLLLEPALLLGIGAGVVLNVIFPSWIIVILLTILLTCESCQRGPLSLSHRSFLLRRAVSSI